MQTLVSLMLLACLWDTNTVADELRGVPELRVLVSDRWYRHGPAYYEFRVKKLEPRLKSDLTLEEYDDLAVAFEHLGQREKALKVLESKANSLERHPDSEHQYRYHANRGTVLAHMGRFEEALAELDKALAINPDAHFGRERFQVDVIKFVMAAKADPRLWETHNFLSYAGYRFWSGKSSAVTPGLKGTGERELDFAEAREAIVGMIRFGGLEGPELYRALGDLSLFEGDLNLGWWFYHYAIEKDHPAKSELLHIVDHIEHHWRDAYGVNLPTETDFKRTRDNAKLWLETFQSLEEQALSEGRDPGDEGTLKALLEQTEQTVPPVAKGFLGQPFFPVIVLIMAVLFSPPILLVVGFGVYRVRKHQAKVRMAKVKEDLEAGRFANR